MRFFLTCPRGLEAILADEVLACGGIDPAVLAGGVSCTGDWKVAMQLNLHSRIATRVLAEMVKGPYRREEDLFRLAMEVTWCDWFAPELTIRVAVTAIRSPLRSLEFATLRIKDGVCDRFRADTGKRPSVNTRDPDVRIHAFLTSDECILYLDTSGDPLYQRGFRQKTVDAPLKENLAAGILKLSGWKPGEALLDPMCGGGTFLLEAAQAEFRIAPGSRRRFAFERLKNFDPARWARLREAAIAEELPVAATLIRGSDHSAQAYRAALANVDRAGLLAAVQVSIADLLDLDAPASSGVMVCNPPYGVRLSEQEQLASFYPRLGQVLKQKFAGWTCCFLSADSRLPKLVGLRPSRKTPLFNGALDCRLYVFEMVAGSNRRQRSEAVT